MIRAALKNPYAVVALSLILVILGAISFRKMTVDIFPQIDIPVLAVATFYKGMGPQQIEGAITLRLEQMYLQAAYVDHIESRSLPGVSLIKVYFHPSYDINAGLAEITSLTYSSLRYLPQGIFPPIIIKFGAANLPIVLQTTSSETLNEKEVRDLAYFDVRPQLGHVPGIAFPTTFGGKIRQITVFMDRERMLARRVSVTDVVQAVNAQSVLLPAGDVKIGDLNYNVYTNSMIEVVEHMNDIPIKVVNGVPIRVRDVGVASDSTTIQTNIVRIDGRRAVYLPIMKQAGANTIQVIDGIKKAVDDLVGLPRDLTVKLIFDQSLYIRQAIQTLEHEGLMGGGLACLMVLLFLGSVRSTFIIALALPLSILGAFALLYFTGQTINIMTLGGLALVIGTLLDNNIVVLENVHRHLAMGKSPQDAAGDGTGEVALPMLVITISILIVYLPIMFFTGIVKFLFVPLAVAVAYTMVVSYTASMTVAPAAMAWLLKPEGGGHGEGGVKAARLFDRLFRRVVDVYVALLRWCLGHKTLVVSSVLAAFGLSLLAAPRLATEFFPKVDAGQFILNVSAPAGTRVEKTEALIAKLEELIRREIPASDLNQIVANIGLPQGFMVLYSPVNGPHQAFVVVSLAKEHSRPTGEIIRDLRRTLERELPGIKFTFQSGGIVSDVLNFGLPAPIDIQLTGQNLPLLAQTAKEIRDRVARIPGTADVQVRQGMDYPEIHLNLDRAKAAYVGLQEREIVKDLVTGLSSNISLDPGYWIDPKSNNAYFVVSQYPEQVLVKFDDFLDMPLVGPSVSASARTTLGETQMRGTPLAMGQTPFGLVPTLPNSDHQNSVNPVLLRDLAVVTRTTGPETVDHYNLQRMVEVLVGVPGNDLGHVAGRIEEALSGVTLPEGVTLTLKGQVDSMRSAITGFAGVLPLAIVLVYLVMVGLFRSYLDPLVIIGAVPLGFIGVIWMLLLTGTSVNVESMIGTLMMIGIVVANSVLLVDFANNRLREGMPLEEAIVEAGRLRIRPVLMTALATIIGLSPMALGLGEGSEMNMPLARAVIGGLLVGTFLTLVFIPVVHAMARRRSAAQPREETSS